mmetsp:Transcript_4080/g.7955  ORF Transcript_4080/g.7955 Transcript_4080/m.7955 type:complete len:340 (+) Transcript_4080:100-1119(+)
MSGPKQRAPATRKKNTRKSWMRTEMDDSSLPDVAETDMWPNRRIAATAAMMSNSGRVDKGRARVYGRRVASRLSIIRANSACASAAVHPTSSTPLLPLPSLIPTSYSSLRAVVAAAPHLSLPAFLRLHTHIHPHCLFPPLSLPFSSSLALTLPLLFAFLFSYPTGSIILVSLSSCLPVERQSRAKRYQSDTAEQQITTKRRDCVTEYDMRYMPTHISWMCDEDRKETIAGGGLTMDPTSAASSSDDMVKSIPVMKPGSSTSMVIAEIQMDMTITITRRCAARVEVEYSSRMMASPTFHARVLRLRCMKMRKKPTVKGNTPITASISALALFLEGDPDVR